MILVTGATGRLGGHVVRALRRMDTPVRALVRRGSEYFWLNDTGCAYFFGDLRDPESLRRACRGVTHIVAASGLELESRGNDHTSVTVEGHARLWRAARERGVRRVVYVSALGVDRGYPVPWFDAKRQAEESLAATGIPHTALRPAPSTRFFLELARRAAHGERVVLPGPGNNRIAPVAMRDLALTAVACLDDGAPDGALDVVGPEVVTAREALDAALQIGGEGRRAFTLPGPVGAALGRAVRPLGRRWKHRADHIRRWFTEDFVATGPHAASVLGLPFTGLRDALKQDLEDVLPREDPSARENLVVHRRFDATVYAPGEAPLSELPAGPLRYDD